GGRLCRPRQRRPARRPAAGLLLAGPRPGAGVGLLDPGRPGLVRRSAEGRGDWARPRRRLLDWPRRAAARTAVCLARRCSCRARLRRLPARVRGAGRARASVQPLRPARGRTARDGAPCGGRARRRPRARRARRRREPAHDEGERVRLRDRRDAPRRPLRHAPGLRRRGAAEARRRARARSPAQASRREADARRDDCGRALGRPALGDPRRPRRVAAQPAARAAHLDGAARRGAAARHMGLPSLRTRRGQVLARAHPRPARVRAHACRPRAEESRRPRAAAARVLAPVLAPDDAGTARLRPRVGGCLVAHSHTHSRAHDRRLLAVALGLIVSLMAGEIVAGLLAGSLALLADAGHMLTDAAALAGALVASRLATRPARGAWTFGFGRAEILAAQANGLTLLLVRIWVVCGPIPHLVSPPVVHGGVVLVVALAGVAVNLAATLVLARADRESLNVRGAFLHVATDLAAFTGTAAAGALVLATGWYRFDAIAGLLV